MFDYVKSVRLRCRGLSTKANNVLGKSSCSCRTRLIELTPLAHTQIDTRVVNIMVMLRNNAKFQILNVSTSLHTIEIVTLHVCFDRCLRFSLVCLGSCALA